MIALECLVVRFALEVERSCSKKQKVHLTITLAL